MHQWIVEEYRTYFEGRIYIPFGLQVPWLGLQFDTLY